MKPTEYAEQRRRVHATFAIRYGLLGLACFAAGFWVWPSRGAGVLALLGYFCTLVSAREQRRERALR